MFLLRIQMAYTDTKYSYSTYTVIYPLYAVLFLFFGAIIYGTFFGITSPYIHENKSCTTTLPGWGIIVATVFDCICSFGCIFLLLTPLYTITKIRKQPQQPQTHTATELNIIHSGIITIFAVITSFFVFLLRLVLDTSYPTQDAIFLTIALLDNLFNTVCIILFENINKSLYQKLCCMFVHVSDNVDTKNNDINAGTDETKNKDNCEKDNPSTHSNKTKKEKSKEIESFLSDMVDTNKPGEVLKPEIAKSGRSCTQTHTSASIALTATLETAPRHAVDFCFALFSFSYIIIIR